MSLLERKPLQRRTRKGPIEAMGAATRLDMPREEVLRRPVPVFNGSLPTGYGETRIVVLAVDPYLVHAYWEVSSSQMGYLEALVEEGMLLPQPLLRFQDVTARSAPGVRTAGSFDVEVDLESSNWYVHLLSPEKAYVVDLGFRRKDGRFHRIASSNRAQTPRAWPCAEAGHQRMCVVEVDGVPRIESVFEEAPVQPQEAVRETTENPAGGQGRIPRETGRAVLDLTQVLTASAEPDSELWARPVVEPVEAPETRTHMDRGDRTEGRVRPVVEAGDARPVPLPKELPVDASGQLRARLAAAYERRQVFPPAGRGAGPATPTGRGEGPWEAARVDLSLFCEELFASGLSSVRFATAAGKDEGDEG